MPDTPVYAITYPCLGPVIDVTDFLDFTNDVEAALLAVEAEATSDGSVTQVPYVFAELTVNPAFSVETAMTMSNTSSSGIAVVGSTFVVITPGLYAIGGKLDSPQSTLTITSQRLAVYVNGVFYAANKWRGSNPADFSVRNGGYSIDLPLAAADAVSFRYLWTGTGALLNPATGTASMTMLATP